MLQEEVKYKTCHTAMSHTTLKGGPDKIPISQHYHNAANSINPLLITLLLCIDIFVIVSNPYQCDNWLDDISYAGLLLLVGWDE